MIERLSDRTKDVLLTLGIGAAAQSGPLYGVAYKGKTPFRIFLPEASPPRELDPVHELAAAALDAPEAFLMGSVEAALGQGVIKHPVVRWRPKR